jgi:apolipoprotein D and lipocalin family protein
MRYITPLLAWLGVLSFCSCSRQPLATVAAVDLERYAGKWHEIASFPLRAQQGCRCTTAEYTPKPAGYVEVFNRCLKGDQVSSIKGKAFPDRGSNNSKLKVQFFWPLRGKYWIIELADDYSYAAVGHPNRKYLWILSRNASLPDNQLQPLLQRLAQKGFDTAQLQYTSHEGC